MTYPITNWAAFDLWVASESPCEDLQEQVLDFLEVIGEDPDAIDSTPVPTMALPLQVKEVPGTRVVLSYTVVKSPPYEPGREMIVLDKIKIV
jgi:hypothetical protein